MDSLPVTIQAGVVGRPDETGPIVFDKKSDGRMRITCQNRQQSNFQRHPAWIADRGFPTAPDDVSSSDEAFPFFPEGGLRIYIAKTVKGDYYAGFKKGFRPAGMKLNDPMWDLYTQGRPRGGVIYP